MLSKIKFNTYYDIFWGEKDTSNFSIFQDKHMKGKASKNSCMYFFWSYNLFAFLFTF